MLSLNKIAIIDPSSYTLPYDYFYLNEISKYYKVDFYYSNTKYNYEYIEKLKNNKNIKLNEYNISSSITSSRFVSLSNYFKMLIKIYYKRNNYKKIHFMWNLFLPIEYLFFKFYGDKFIFTFHNNVPHSFDKKVYKPYKIINNLANKKIFVSDFTKEEFLSNYENIGDYFVLNHGIMPINDEYQRESSEFLNDENLASNVIYFWGRIEEYKGVDIFVDNLKEFVIKIYGKWNKDLWNLKSELSTKNNIEIIDDYLSNEELEKLLTENNIFILPYKDATQSGVLYTLLAYEKVFISNDVGENSKFLKSNDLEELVFNRTDEQSILNAFNYANKNYYKIKQALKEIKNKYEWSNTISEINIKEIYD